MGGATPSAVPDGQAPARWRWVVSVFRIAAALVTIDYLSTRHRWVQLVVVPLGLLALWWDWRLGAVVLALALTIFVAYRLVVLLIERLVLPRRTRRALLDARDEIRAEFDRLNLPTGPLSGLHFTWRLARGKRPHAELMTRMNEGIDRVAPLVSQSLTDVRNL